MKYQVATFLVFVTSVAAIAQDVKEVNKEEILKVRAASNLAIKNHQIDVAVSYLTEDSNIAASNGAIFSGRNAFKEALTNIFELNPDLYFVRNADEVLINTANTVAWEKGVWLAERPQTVGWKNYGGNYSAYWVKEDGVWKIKSELFVRLY